MKFLLRVVPIHQAATLVDDQLILDLQLLRNAKDLIDNGCPATPGDIGLIRKEIRKSVQVLPSYQLDQQLHGVSIQVR